MLRRRRPGSATNAGNFVGVLVRLDDVVDPQPVDVDAAPCLERPRRRFVHDLRHGVAVVGDRRVVLVDRARTPVDLAVGEADPVRRLGAREDHLRDAELHGGVDDVVRAERVHAEGLVVGRDEDRRDRSEVHHRVVGRDAGAGLELVEARVGRQGVEHLPGVGQVDPQVGDARMAQREEIAVGDPVALLDQVGDRMATGLAGTAGEEDAHGLDRTELRAVGSPENDKRRRPDRSAAFQGVRDSECSDVLSLVALATLANVEFDTLTLVEGLVAITRDVGVVDEDVLPALA